jgi:hypothetical protein
MKQDGLAGTVEVKCSEFGDEVIRHMEAAAGTGR